MRRDVLPDAYIVALQALQGHVAPFPTKDAIEEIERGLGRPLAVASIAQYCCNGHERSAPRPP